MGKTINKSVQFELLPSNEVLVTVTVSAGEPGKSDITTVVRQRIDCGEFCSKAFPIMYQHYNSWPPPAQPNPNDSLKPKLIETVILTTTSNPMLQRRNWPK